MDPKGDFLEARGEVTEGAEKPKGGLYRAYVLYQELNGHQKHKIIDVRKFNALMRDRGFGEGQQTIMLRFWTGVTLVFGEGIFSF